MIARLRRSQEEDKGFTLVELLVVIIIIGILSAVAVPVYLNQQKKARDTSANSDVSNLGKQIQTALIDQPTAGSIQFKIDASSLHYQISTDGGTNFEDIGRASAGVVLLDKDGKAVTNGTATAVSGLNAAVASESDWCIAVNHSGGASRDFRYSNKGGIEAKKTCADA